MQHCKSHVAFDRWLVLTRALCSALPPLCAALVNPTDADGLLASVSNILQVRSAVVAAKSPMYSTAYFLYFRLLLALFLTLLLCITL